MVTIYGKSIYSIAGKIYFQTGTTKFEFLVPDTEKKQIRVVLIPDEKKIYAFYSTKVSDAFYLFLQQGIRDVPDEFNKERLSFSAGISEAVKKVLCLIKYHLGCFDLDEYLIGFIHSEWSIDNAEWKIFPTPMCLFDDGFSTFPVDNNSASLIQKYLDDGYEPFTAFRYLHKAKLESMPHHKWIETTTAAELAIKEFLIRYKPEIETLLIEMPSPPIYKLYGLVLESLGLKKFPLTNKLQKGIEKRNHLVHRPTEITITQEEAREYFNVVEFAIYHLILLLYPDDPYIKSFYEALKFEFDL